MDRKQLVIISLVSGVGFICYLNTLKAGFVYDDNRAIIENSDIKPRAPWTNILSNDFWGTPLSHSGSHKSYRPLCVLSFRLNYLFDGLNPRGYHLCNVLLHSISCALFTALASQLLVNSTQCIFAGLLFAVHSVHSEAVAGVVGRADIGCGLFFILSLMFYQKAATRPTPTKTSFNSLFFILSIVCCIASILMKEIGITSLGVMILYDVVFIMRPKFNGFSSMFKQARECGTLHRTIALVTSACLLLYVRLTIMNHATPVFSSSDNPASNHDDVIVRLLTFLYLPVFNVSLLLFPWQLSFDWSMESIPLVTSISDSRNFLSLSLYSVLVIAIFKYVRYCQVGSYHHSDHTDSDLVPSKCNIDGWRNKLLPQITGNYYYKLPQNPFTNGCFETNLFRSAANEICSDANGHEDVTAKGDRTLRNGSREYRTTKKRNCNQKTKLTFEKNSCHKNGRKTEGVVNSNGTDHYNRHASLMQCNEHVTDFQHDNNDYSTGVFLLGMMIIPFIPATNLFFYVGFVVAERILYIPSIGFCLLVALGFGHLDKKLHHRFRPALKMFACVYVALLAARTVLRNEDWFDEEALYRSGLEVNPSKAWSNLGNILSQKGRASEAEEAYNTALKHRPNMADTEYNLGVLLQNMKRHKEAINCYKNAIKYRPSFAAAHLNLGLTYDAIGLKQDALKTLTNAKDINDFGLKNPKAHLHSLVAIRYNIGKIYFNMQNYKKSIDVFHEAIKMAPSDYSPHSIYNMLGQAYSFIGEVENAEIWYWRSLQSNTTHVPAHLTYARHLASSKGKVEEAESWFKKALKIQPNRSDSHFHYGQFLISTGRREEGLRRLERAIELNPRDAELTAITASSFREAKDYEKAEKYFKLAVEHNPNAPHSHMNLGALYHLTGRLDEAEHSYFEALRLNPGDQLTISNIKKLKTLKARSK